MKKYIYYCMVLSEEQLDFLAESKYGIDRMKVLRYLIGAATVKETKYEKKGFVVAQHIGQAVLSEVDLANRLGYDKKTVSRMLDKMATLGIVSSEQTNRTSIHTVHCVSAWYADNQKILNPYYVSMKERHESHTENGNNHSDEEDIVPCMPKDATAKPDTSAEANFHSGLESTEINKSLGFITPLNEYSNSKANAGEQSVLSSLSSEEHASPGSNDSHSPDTGQDQSGNHSAREIQPGQL